MVLLRSHRRENKMKFQNAGDLEHIRDSIFEKISRLRLDSQEVVIPVILEFGHVIFPLNELELNWSISNTHFAEKLCKELITKYKKGIRIVPFMIVNDLGLNSSNERYLPKKVETILEKNKFLQYRKVNFLYERNLRNRAAKRLKTLFQKEDIDPDLERIIMDDSCPIPMGNIRSDGFIVPRCSSILAAFVEKAVEQCYYRLPDQNNFPIVLVSFSQSEHEFYQTENGIALFNQGWESNICPSPIIEHVIIPWRNNGKQQ